MKCPTKPPVINTKCGTDTPLMDYIPQRLRWMTEWAEWYCKVQKEAYEELEKQCRNCRSGICENGKNGCEKCTKACKDYNSKIEPWREQWAKIKTKYEQLYKKAQNSDTSNSGTTYPKDEKDVISFLSKLHKKNKDSNKIYETAEGYVHQELPNMGCKEQTRFCKTPNDKISTSDGKDNDKEDLYTGEEISYNIHMSTNSMDDPKYVSNNVYSGIDLINDTLSGNKHIDIYDEVLKRKENELFGTNYKKNTSNNSVAKNTNNDPIMNQLDLLHKWLDRHRDMCNTWNTKEELLDKLNEQWNKDNDGGDISSDSNKRLNTDVSIQIDMDDTTGKKELSNMDINVDTPTMDNMEDDIYYDVNDDENPFVDDIPMDHNKVDVPKKVHVEMKILNNTSNGSLEQEFPISDVWNI
ncbi:hypothetical protein PFHG_05270 [Plasmodium falciparum HB3]|uniref:Plasmodium falciparum erythrocyte membrane protein 1 acidic terminal segment domain-containing protein n=1 Tax=Plasmodium falciparum (isolate HB3) TaxID=137071 RepID=A0A0L7KKE3_PLAFX|nr:hypothetical protein PFHG_05270 [Plasmodium falciparum HB3]